jgi:hypothetical protein
LFSIVTSALIAAPLVAENVFAWILDIELTNKPFKDDSAYVKVQGPDGWENSQWYDWADIKTGPGTGLVSWSLPESDFPSGEKYRVCVSSKAVFALFPDCNDFIHGSGDEMVSVSLSRLAK